MMTERLKRHFQRHGRSYLAGLIVAVVVGGVLLAGQAMAQTSGGISGGAVKPATFIQKLYAFLGDIVLVILQFVANLTAMAIHVIIIVSQYNHFIDVPVVKTGWTIVRDITNMFFIIALLVIAAGTILRIENYRYNRLLARVIVMAFLVNFSRLIAGFFIQSAQVVMLTFVNAYKDAFFGNFAHLFGLDSVLRFASEPGPVVERVVDFGIILISLLAGLALLVVSLVVSLAIAIILAIRIIALWILVIFSPLAYALRILPNTEGFSRRWWSEFGKYVTVGPVMAFMLWLSLAIIVSTGATAELSEQTSVKDLAKQYAGENVSGSSQPFVNELLSLENLTSFLIGIIFLVMGLSYATQLGGAAGRFAGSATTAATGAALGASGVAWMRDRTVAPVQGWLRNRQAAARARVEERTQTLEAAGDRLRTAFPGAGAERSRAAAAAYERQRTARRIAERGYEDRSHDELMTEFQHGRGRGRVAAMEVLRRRGEINLTDPNQNAALNQVLASGRMPPGERRKIRQEILQANVGNMADPDVRARLAAAGDRDEQIVLAQELERRKALNAENAGDQAIINGLRGNLAEVPARLKEFDDSLKRNNPRMALETIYEGFTRGAANVDQLLNDIQQGTYNAANLNVRDVATMTRSLRNVSGLGRDEAQSYVGNQILTNARSKEEYDRIMNSMQSDTRDIAHNDLQVAAAIPAERRRWLADQAYLGEAYAGNDAAADFYVRNNSDKVLENLKKERISRRTWQTDAIVESITNQDRIGINDLAEAVRNTPAVRNHASATFNRISHRINTTATANTNDATQEGRRQNKLRRSFVAVSGGGDVNDLMMGPVLGAPGAQISSLQAAFRMGGAATTAAFTTARQGLERTIATVGNRLNRLDFARLHTTPQGQVIERAVVENLKVSHLAEIDERNPGLAQNIVQQIRTTAALPAGTTYAGRPLTGDDIDRLNGTLNRIRRSDRLSYL
ncbi:MAG: hypothetical protein HYY50_01375 [Candidatus Kerfeldbacteria bacterium]|nr:hypothetical protein [Candidatus Kerfeldbacteria bacterium]